MYHCVRSWILMARRTSGHIIQPYVACEFSEQDVHLGTIQTYVAQLIIRTTFTSAT